MSSAAAPLQPRLDATTYPRSYPGPARVQRLAGIGSPLEREQRENRGNPRERQERHRRDAQDREGSELVRRSDVRQQQCAVADAGREAGYQDGGSGVLETLERSRA